MEEVNDVLNFDPCLRDYVVERKSFHLPRRKEEYGHSHPLSLTRNVSDSICFSCHKSNKISLMQAQLKGKEGSVPIRKSNAYGEISSLNTDDGIHLIKKNPIFSYPSNSSLHPTVDPLSMMRVDMTEQFNKIDIDPLSMTHSHPQENSYV